MNEEGLVLTLLVYMKEQKLKNIQWGNYGISVVDSLMMRVPHWSLWSAYERNVCVGRLGQTDCRI